MAQSNDFIVKNGLVVKTTATIYSVSQSDDTSTGALIVYGGTGIGGNLNVGGHVIGGGVRTSSTSTTPQNATVGDLWYNTNNDVTYRYTYDGVSNNWVDITGATSNPFYGGFLAVSSLSVTDSTVAISTTTGALTVAGGVGIKGSIYAGKIYSNGILLGPTGPGSTSTQNIAGGEPGQIPYQENTNVTTFFGPGTPGQILVSNGASVPLYTTTGTIHVGKAQFAVTATYASNITNTGSIHVGTAQYSITATNAFDLINTASTHVGFAQNSITATYAYVLLEPQNISVGSSFTANTATNLANGTLGQLPYQTGPGATSFIGPGSAGQILVSQGTNAPAYKNTVSIHVAAAQYSITATNAFNLINTGSTHVRTAQFAVTASSALILSNTSTTFVGRASIANNLNGGAFGSLPFQSSTGTTTFLPLGSNNLVLIASTSGPQWATLDAVSAGLSNTATNLAFGQVGQVPYQSAPGITSFFGPGTAGQILVSSGTSAPSYVSTGSIHVGTAQVAVTAQTSSRLLNTGTTHVGAAQYAVTSTYAVSLLNTGSTHVAAAQYAITATNSLYAGITNNSVSSNPRFLTFTGNNNGFSNLETDNLKLNYVPVSGLLTVPSLFISSSNANTGTTTSNALYVAGGAYIDSLLVNRSSIFNGPVVFNGTATYVYTTNTVYTDNILELHVPPTGVGTPWLVDDGKNIGLRFHYYKSGQDKTSFLGQANDTGYLEWFISGTENPSGIFTGSAYGGIKAGVMILATATNATNTTTGALQVAGGVGIQKDVYIGGNITVGGVINGSLGGVAITTASNIANGLAGQLLYQVETGATSFVGPGTPGQLLTSAGSDIPTYVDTSTIHVGTADYAANAGSSAYASTATTSTYAATAYTLANTASTYVGFAGVANTSTYAATAYTLANTSTIHVASAQYTVTATNVDGGDIGSLPYQTTTGTTTFLPLGTLNYVLKAGVTGPEWGTIDIVTVAYANTATNLANGTAGQIPYQTDAGATSFTGPGQLGNLLVSGGTNGPSYVNTSSIHVRFAQVAITATIATTSTYSQSANTATYAGIAYSLIDTSTTHVGIADYAVTAGTLSNTATFQVGFASNATNIVGGNVGAVPYQTTTGSTTFLSLGSNGYILVAGTTAPEWASLASLGIGNATSSTNISGGTSGQIPYQVSEGNTSFFGPGTAGQILVSSGTSAPSYISTASIHVRLSQLAITATNAVSLLNTGTAHVGVAQFSITATNATRLLNTGTVHVGTAQIAVTATLALLATTASNLSNTATTQVAYAVTSTNLTGGTAGSLPYQTAFGKTTLLPLGAGGFVLTAGALAPQWTEIASLSAGVANTATNIAGGTPGQIPYQFGSGITLFTGPGTAGQLLVSAGTDAPIYTNTGSIYVGYAVSSDNAVVTNDASNSTPQYLTFVPNDTGSNGIKTDSSKFTYQSDIGQLTTPKLFLSNSNSDNDSTNTNALYVAGGVYVKGNTTFAGGVTFNGTATYVYSTNTYYTDNLIELHVPPSGPTGAWNVNDGKDIGIRFHYYNNIDQNAALILANDSGYLEWYSAGTETTTGTFVGSAYGGIKAGTLLLTTGTNATTTNSGALVVQGGVGIWRDLIVGGNVTISGTVSATVNGTITSSTNIAGGTTGAIPYQSATGVTKFINIGASGSMLISNGTTATYSNTVSSLVVSGTVRHNGLVPTAGTSIDQIYTTSTSLTLSTSWQNIGVTANQLAAGTYLVQVLANDVVAGGGQVNTYYSGVMSWWNGATTENSFDELALHRAGSASSTGSIYLQVLRSSSGYLNLQMAGNTNNIIPSTYNFSFRRMI